MCGITGFIDYSRSQTEVEMVSIVKDMATTLRHRGPDDSGAWVDSDAGVALGHRRLSVIDISKEGHQPMSSLCGRYVLSYNGEIYNFKELSSELRKRGYKFRGHSDTEVVVNSFCEWGVERSLARFNGMFALAVWDSNERVLWLARDRMGEKPLYYGRTGSTFLFASELKALRMYPDFSGEIDRNALALYLRHNYIPAPYSVYRGIGKLNPGSFVKIDGNRYDGSLKPKPYWSVKETAKRGVCDYFEFSEREAVDKLNDLLRSAVLMRMVADVPLGVFLSGGIDSSTVVAIMQEQSARPVKSFTLGFHEKSFNEAEDARLVAKHLGTEHTELYVTPEETMSVISLLPALYDEPFSDSSQIPTYLVSRLARQHVTVCLSGDGGDELFAGYNRYFWWKSFWKQFGWMSESARLKISAFLNSISPVIWERIFRVAAFVKPSLGNVRLPVDKVYKFADILGFKDQASLYLALISHWANPDSIVIGSIEPTTVISDNWEWDEYDDLTLQMMYLDMVTYLPDDILAKVDRASMGVSLEARVPFLDPDVIEFAWNMPMSMKIRDRQGKWLLRQVLYRYLPKNLIERPKMGFGVPIDSWLRGPLKEWAGELLSESRLANDGFFESLPIIRKWEEHQKGARNWQYHLWDILVFQTWLDSVK